MKSPIASADMTPITNTKNPSRKYFKPRSGRSAHRGRRGLRPRIFLPSFHRFSESVPTGQSQEQKAFFRNRLISRKAMNRNIAAGWMSGTLPVTTSHLKFMNRGSAASPRPLPAEAHTGPRRRAQNSEPKDKTGFPASRSAPQTTTAQTVWSFATDPAQSGEQAASSLRSKGLPPLSVCPSSRFLPNWKRSGFAELKL